MARGHYQLVPRTHYKNVNVLTASDIPLGTPPPRSVLAHGAVQFNA